jgi:uncharacterized membrane protein
MPKEQTVSEQTNGNGIYKIIAVCLMGVVVSVVGAYFAASHNVVTKEELPALIQQNNPYTQDAKDIKSKLDDLKERIIKLDDYQKQIGQDVADIAAKSGVSAHPITDSNPRRKPYL